MQYDLVLAGYGLAGMSLLHALSKDERFPQKSVLVIDMDEKRSNDRTWSFWSDRDLGLGAITWKTWSDGTVYGPDGAEIPLDLRDYNYNTIRGLDYYEFVRKELAPFDNVTYVYDRILHADPSGRVDCSQGSYQGDLVVKSFFLREELPIDGGSEFLWQHFKGWFIKTPEDRFQADQVTLMDYRACSPDRTNFFYVLPQNTRQALVEFTEFSADFYSQEEYDQKIRDYLKTYWDLEDYEIEEVEFNAIPMTDAQFSEPVQGRLVHIGTLGGYVKASSGYCFTRTLDKNAVLARAIMDGKAITADLLRGPSRFLAYDRVVLHLMATGKVHGQEMFSALFQKLGGDKVFRFLDERSKLPDELQVMLSVPHKPLFVGYYLRRALGMRP